MAQARRLGGPRQPDPLEAQIRLELAGETVATLLSGIAEQSGTRPIEPVVFEQAMKQLSGRVFSVTGTALAAPALSRLSPPAGGPWTAVPAPLWQEAVREAYQQALQHDGATSTSAPTPGQPVTRVEFTDDMKIRVSVVATGDAGVARVTWGEASVEMQFTPSPRRVVLPLTPPSWAREQTDVTASAGTTGNRLRTARVAEGYALDQMALRLSQLPLGELSLGEAARLDPRVAESLDRALTRARVYRADYDPNGSVTVKVSLDLRTLWQDLSTLLARP